MVEYRDYVNTCEEDISNVLVYYNKMLMMMYLVVLDYNQPSW